MRLMERFGSAKETQGEGEGEGEGMGVEMDDTDNAKDSQNGKAKNLIAFLYYSTVLTTLTVMVALVIGTIQSFALILNAVGGKRIRRCAEKR